MMLVPASRLILAVAVALYLYYLLPATAALFYELYHLTEIGAIYWGYSGFKAAGYYFGTWQYQLHTCVGVALAILFIPALYKTLRGN